MQGYDPDTRASINNRLSRIEGQIRGIRRLIDEEAECEKIAQQMAAARKALDKTFHEMLACMIEKDVLDTRKDNAAEANMSQIRDLLSKYA
ncbi:MAG: metal-sensing transcriptional repressor [Gammaproteobacteria bacterium]